MGLVAPRSGRTPAIASKKTIRSSPRSLSDGRPFRMDFGAEDGEVVSAVLGSNAGAGVEGFRASTSPLSRVDAGLADGTATFARRAASGVVAAGSARVSLVGAKLRVRLRLRTNGPSPRSVEASMDAPLCVVSAQGPTPSLRGAFARSRNDSSRGRRGARESDGPCSTNVRWPTSFRAPLRARPRSGRPIPPRRTIRRSGGSCSCSPQFSSSTSSTS